MQAPSFRLPPSAGHSERRSQEAHSKRPARNALAGGARLRDRDEHAELVETSSLLESFTERRHGTSSSRGARPAHEGGDGELDRQPKSRRTTRALCTGRCPQLPSSSSPAVTSHCAALRGLGADLSDPDGSRMKRRRSWEAAPISVSPTTDTREPGFDGVACGRGFSGDASATSPSDRGAGRIGRGRSAPPDHTASRLTPDSPCDERLVVAPDGVSEQVRTRQPQGHAALASAPRTEPCEHSSATIVRQSTSRSSAAEPPSHERCVEP